MEKQMKEKVILVDCDGVLLDWVYAFTQWMDRHGYELDPNADKIYSINQRYNISKDEGKRLVRMFNESAVIRKLPPLRDAMKYVRKLHEQHGYVFHAITSLSNDQYAQHLRTKNLIELFGPTPFEKYVYLDTGADKDEALEEYRDTGCYWIEDKPENCDVGIEMGLESLLIAHEHNANYKGSALRVQNWKEIYKVITE
jgi:FMN phosphatase YigB (HAD superfamily)